MTASPEADPLLCSGAYFDNGTFSKVLSPGFRLGYIIGPKAALDPLTTIKQAVDLHTSTFTQLISARCLDEGLMKTHMPDRPRSLQNSVPLHARCFRTLLPRRHDLDKT